MAQAVSWDLIRNRVYWIALHTVRISKRHLRMYLSKPLASLYNSPSVLGLSLSSVLL